MAHSIQPLIDQITANNQVVDSAVVLINGILARIQAAVDLAIAEGASPEALARVTEEVTLQTAKVTALSEAIAANTPAAE